jgi:hypothetical protein
MDVVPDYVLLQRAEIGATIACALVENLLGNCQELTNTLESLNSNILIV